MAHYDFSGGSNAHTSGKAIIIPAPLGQANQLRVAPFGQYLGIFGRFSNSINAPSWDDFYCCDFRVLVTSAQLKLTNYSLWSFSPQKLNNYIRGYNPAGGAIGWFGAAPISFSDVMKFCNLFATQTSTITDFQFITQYRLTTAQVLALVPSISDTDTILPPGATDRITWAEFKNNASYYATWHTEQESIYPSTIRYNYDTITWTADMGDDQQIPNIKQSCATSRIGTYFDSDIIFTSSGAAATIATKGGVFYYGNLQIGWGITSINNKSNNQDTFPYTQTTLSCPVNESQNWIRNTSNNSWTGLRTYLVVNKSEIISNCAEDYEKKTASFSWISNLDTSYTQTFDYLLYKYRGLSVTNFEAYRTTETGAKSPAGDYITFIGTYDSNLVMYDRWGYNYIQEYGTAYNRPTLDIVVTQLWSGEVVYEEHISDYPLQESGAAITVGNFELDPETSYIITVTYKDNFTPIGSKGAAIIPTRVTYFEWGKNGKGLAIGKYNELDKFEILFDTIFNKTCIFLAGEGVEKMGDAASLIPYNDTYNIGCNNVQEVIDWLNRRLS